MKKAPTKKQIEAARAVLKKAGYFGITWTLDDIKEQYAQWEYGDEETSDLPRINDKAAREIADFIEKSHNADIGINTEVIESAIETMAMQRRTQVIK